MTEPEEAQGTPQFTPAKLPAQANLDLDRNEPEESGVNVYENSPLSTTGGKTPSFPAPVSKDEDA